MFHTTNSTYQFTVELVIYNIVIHRVSKLQSLCKSLPATVEEVKDIEDEYQSVLVNSTEALTFITANYDSHNKLDQTLSQVEHGLTDLEERLKGLSGEKAEPGEMSKHLQVLPVNDVAPSHWCRFIETF